MVQYNTNSGKSKKKLSDGGRVVIDSSSASHVNT